MFVVSYLIFICFVVIHEHLITSWFGAMSGNLLFIFDHPIITRQLNILTNQTTALIVFGFRCYWIKKKKWRKKKIQQTSNFNLIGRLADIWQYYNAWKPDIFLSYFHNLFCVTKRESKWQGFKYFKYFDISWQKNY
jgi:hypothetical protein